MKIIFLIGEAKTVLDLWNGKTKKGKRALTPSRTKLNGSPVFDGSIIERKGRERAFRFLFVVLDKRKIKKIPEMLERLDVSSEESAIIMTDGEKDIIGEMGIMSGKRYHSVESCKFLVFLKGSIQIKDVNELASVLFLNREDEMSRQDGKLNKALEAR